MSSTYSVVTLALPEAMVLNVARQLLEAGYTHAVGQDGRRIEVDMTGIVLVVADIEYQHGGKQIADIVSAWKNADATAHGAMLEIERHLASCMFQPANDLNIGYEQGMRMARESGSTPAAPGIDLGTAIRNCCEAEQADPDHPDTICINVDDLTLILQQCVIDASPKDDVPRDDLVPGVMRCAKCSFQLHRTNLYLGSGTTGPGDSKTEPCPNGCGPLWPVTWQTWATDGWQQAERYHEELRQLQDSPKGGSDACIWTDDGEGNWATACGEIFTLMEGSPAENKMRHCPYCGKNLRATDADVCGAVIGASYEDTRSEAHDAARYRWLRNHYEPSFHDSECDSLIGLHGEDLDDAIDDEMQATSAEVGA